MGERIHRFFEHNEKNQRLGEDWDPHKKLSSEPHETKPQFPPQGTMAESGPGVSVCMSRLFLSLLSGLPNEQEFALGVCSLLSSSEDAISPLHLSPRMVELLVAQAGIWQQQGDGVGSMGQLYLESWRELEGRNMHLFWRSTLQPHGAELSRVLGLDLGEGQEGDEFWNLDSDPGPLHAEGQRVLKVALILHNLSFEKNNVPVLVNSTIFMRFLLLSIHSSWANLKQTAFDTLANIAPEVRLCSVEGDTTASSCLLLRVVLEGLSSDDRFVSLRSMDALAQLCGRTPNDELIPPRMNSQMYERMVSFLTVHDVMLLFCTLEALYALSDLGKAPCDRIACVHGSIGVLVSLLTLDPGQYGPSAEIKMKIVEILVPAEPGSPHQEHIAAQPRKTPTVSVTSSEVSVVPSPTISVTSKEVNSETFASNWLKGQYEMFPGSLVSRNEIYAEYVGFCAKAERKGVVNANVFANCVKSSFPQVELRKVQSPGGVITFHHDGLRRKRASNLPIPPRVSKDSFPATVVLTCAPVVTKPPQKPIQSPILQAQLSAPTKPSDLPAKQLTPIAHSPLSSPSSTLIKSLLANKVQQRTTATVHQRHVVPVQQRQVILHHPGLQKMVIFSPGGKGGQGLVRCVVPQVNLQAARFVAAPQHQLKVLQPQLNGVQNDTVCSKSSNEVATPILQVNCVQNNVSNEFSSAKDLLASEVSSSLLSPKDVQVNTSSDQSFILSQIQGNTITYRLAGPEELTLSSGNRLFLRSKPQVEALSMEPNGNGVFLNSKKVLTQQPFLQPKSTPTTMTVIADSKLQLRKEDICKKSPLLNGLLDKGRPPSGDILFNALVENGIEASDVGLELPQTHPSPVQSLLLPQTKRSSQPLNSIVIPTSSLNSFLLPASSESVVVPSSFILSAPAKLDASKGVIPPKSVITSSFSSILLPSQSSPAFTVAPSPVCSNGSGSSSLVRIRSGQATFSGTAELQADQTGVVRLHIESPENSNQGSSDLSSISDIARTLECASEAISRTNAECNTQVPRSGTPVTFAVSPTASNAVSQGGIMTTMAGGQGGAAPLNLNSMVGNIIGHMGASTLAMNSVTGNIIGQAATLTGNIIGQSAPATLAVNSVAGNIIGQGGVMTLGGNIIGQGGAANLAVNSVTGNIIGQGSAANIIGQVGSATLAVNSVAGNIIGQSGAANILGQVGGATLAMNSVTGNIIGQGGATTLSMNSVAGSSISQSSVATLAMNTVTGNIIGQGGATTLAVNSVTGGIVSQATSLGRPNQQIFVVTSPTLGQQQLQSPNIKFCILHTVPMGEESADQAGAAQISLAQMPQDSPSPNVSLKRPSNDAVCVMTNTKKPRVDPQAVQSSTPIAVSGHTSAEVERPSTPKGNSAKAVLVSGSDLPSEREAKTFSGLTSASGNDLPPTSVPSKAPPSAKLEFVCEWKSCGLKFLKPGQVFLHASRVHTPASVEALPCLWEGCDNMRRRRFSLLTHLQDWHCNERVLQLQAARRLQMAREGQSQLPPPPKPPPHPGYAPDAAVLAIKRHALQYNNPKELAEEKESALTKSIRLTSALILRNLVMHSSLARTYVRRFEAELAYLAMSPVESAKAIAQCLSHLSACD